MGKPVYLGFHVLGILAVFEQVVRFGRKLDITPKKSVLVVLTVCPIIYAWMYVLFWIESGFSSFSGNNIVRVFIYVPLAGYPVAKMLKIEWNKICSLLAFAPTIVHAVSHLGCIFFRCCKGYPSAFGFYNPISCDIRFPSQLVESLITWAIIGYLLYRAVKRNYIPDGKEFPIMLILFGSTRFLCEFARDNEKTWRGISNLAVHALFMCVVGLVALAVIGMKEKKSSPAS